MPVTEITELREKTMKLSQKCFVNAKLDVSTIQCRGACASISIRLKRKRQDH